MMQELTLICMLQVPFDDSTFIVQSNFSFSSFIHQVSILPNMLCKMEKELLVFLKDIEGCQLALPVSARVVVPDLKFEL